MLVFPVSPDGKPTFQDDFNYVRPGGLQHQGTDIFAPEGTPVMAVDNGTVMFGTNKLGGNVAHLTIGDGTTYYYAHLSAYEGDSPRIVLAGDTIGYVGTTGNAQGGKPHLHFGKYLSGSKTAVNAYDDLAAIAPKGATYPKKTVGAAGSGFLVMGAGLFGGAILIRRLFRR